MISVNGLTPDQTETIESLLHILGIISVVCCSLVVITYLLFERKRHYPASFTLYFALASLGFSMAVIPRADIIQVSTAKCIFQATMIQYFGFATILWWFFVSLNLHAIVVKGVTHEHFISYYHLAGWGIPAIFTMVPAWFDQFGKAGVFCWIHDPAWSFGTYYGELAVILLIGTYLWFKIIRKALQVVQQQADPGANWTMCLRHILFVSTFFLAFLSMFVHSLFLAVQKSDRENYVLLVLHAIAIGGQGIILFLVFGLTSDNYQTWKESTRDLWYRLRYGQSQYSSI